MPRIYTEPPRDFIESERAGDEIIFRNPRTLKEIRLPKDASPAERLKARQALQEVVSDPFAGVKAAEGLDLMARGGKELPQEPSDPEPRVCLSPGLLQDKQLAAHAQWVARAEAKQQRERQLRDRREVIDGIVEGLKAKEPEPEPAPQIDLTESYKLRWNTGVALAKARANPATSADTLKILELENQAAWGVPVEGSDDANS